MTGTGVRDIADGQAIQLRPVRPNYFASRLALRCGYWAAEASLHRAGDQVRWIGSAPLDLALCEPGHRTHTQRGARDVSLGGASVPQGLLEAIQNYGSCRYSDFT